MYFLNVVSVKRATSSVTIDKLRGICSNHGFQTPLSLTMRLSLLVHHFYMSNGIKHITSAPYHPATNCLAEHLSFLKVGSLETQIQRFLELLHIAQLDSLLMNQQQQNLNLTQI